MVGSLWHETGAGFDINILDPTQDKALMEFCIGVPADQYIMQGKDRMLIRRAMKGIMPDEVRWNTIRGRQAADIGYRVVENKMMMIDCMNEIKQLPLANKILDINKMDLILNSVMQQVNKENTSGLGSVLLRGMMMGLFLKSQENS